MPKYKNNKITEGLSGTFGKQFVFKHYPKGTVISKYPDMSKVKPSAKQLKAKSRFQEAVFYAKGILADPERKKMYNQLVPEGKTVYHYAIAEYMAKHKSS